MHVELSAFIETDLEAIADYIAADSPVQAVKLVQQIRGKLALIAENPWMYQLRPEIGDEARMAVIGRYLILFRIVGETVYIERVVFGGRDLPALFL